MQRREFITAAVGMAAAVASASQAFAQDYPDAGAIKKMPVGEGAAGAAKKGIEGEAGAAKKGIIEKITEAIGGGEMEGMHPPKYKALEDSASKCVVTGNDCLRHCYGMFSMKDTSMAACANAAFHIVLQMQQSHLGAENIFTHPRETRVPQWAIRSLSIASVSFPLSNRCSRLHTSQCS